MKIIFLGATKFSEEMLLHLLANGFEIEAIFTIPKEFNISYSHEKVKNCNYANLDSIAKERTIKIFEVDGAHNKRLLEYRNVIRDMKADVILVLGWYYMVPETIRKLAKYGAWGIHASLLPQYAGGAPLNWAIINGEKKAGITLFRLDDGVDDGDIIEQKSFRIDFEDSIKEVYDKATAYSKGTLTKALANIKNIKYKPQDKEKIKVYPQRKPDDGKIDFTKSALEIYNFIRAQSSPYPGAFCEYKGEKIILWKVEIYHDREKVSTVLGQIISRNSESGDVIVTTGKGKIKIIEIETDTFKGKPAVVMKTIGDKLK